MKRRIAGVATIAATLALALPAAGASAADISESFDTVVPSRWSIYNNSTFPGVSQAWFQGSTTSDTPFPGPFNAHDGAANAYAAANYLATGTPNSTISTWLVTRADAEGPTLRGLPFAARRGSGRELRGDSLPDSLDLTFDRWGSHTGDLRDLRDPIAGRLKHEERPLSLGGMPVWSCNSAAARAESVQPWT